jgi:hypothetical protein
VPQGKTENTKDKKVTCTVESEKGGRKKMGVERCPQRHSHSHKGSSSKQQVRSGPAAQGREREREHIQARESPVQQLGAVVGHPSRPITTTLVIINY